MNHTYYKCPPGCGVPNCHYCQGGLAMCTVCGGAEGSLTSECPGRNMTEEQDKEVYHGDLDFKDGKWTTKPKLTVVK